MLTPWGRCGEEMGRPWEVLSRVTLVGVSPSPAPCRGLKPGFHLLLSRPAEQSLFLDRLRGPASTLGSSFPLICAELLAHSLPLGKVWANSSSDGFCLDQPSTLHLISSHTRLWGLERPCLPLQSFRGPSSLSGAHLERSSPN